MTMTPTTIATLTGTTSTSVVLRPSHNNNKDAIIGAIISGGGSVEGDGIALTATDTLTTSRPSFNNNDAIMGGGGGGNLLPAPPPASIMPRPGVAVDGFTTGGVGGVMFFFVVSVRLNVQFRMPTLSPRQGTHVPLNYPGLIITHLQGTPMVH